MWSHRGNDSVSWEHLVEAGGSSICEWRGAARYGRIRDFVSFYPGRVACFVDGERVKPQPGRFYGGWITSDVVGPFKGDPGTGHW